MRANTIAILFISLAKTFTTVSTLPSCDFEAYPGDGCSSKDDTMCEMTSQKCVCRMGYPVEINGRCFQYSQVGSPCFSSSQCFKSKCVNSINGDEIYLEGGTVPTKGICTCTEDRIADTKTNECVQRFIFQRCIFSNQCPKNNAHCDRQRCGCHPHYQYDMHTDECIPNLSGSTCFPGFITVHENNVTRCKNRQDSASFYPYFRRPSFANLVWPLFAFFLVVLMFKLLKEGIDRECPHPGHTSFDYPSGSGNRLTSNSRARPSLNFVSGSSNTNANLSALPTTRPRVTRSPSSETVVSLPPPYDGRISQRPFPVPGDAPPSYEEATRKQESV